MGTPPSHIKHDFRQTMTGFQMNFWATCNVLTVPGWGLFIFPTGRWVHFYFTYFVFPPNFIFTLTIFKWNATLSIVRKRLCNEIQHNTIPNNTMQHNWPLKWKDGRKRYQVGYILTGARGMSLHEHRTGDNRAELSVFGWISPITDERNEVPRGNGQTNGQVPREQVPSMRHPVRSAAERTEGGAFDGCLRQCCNCG